MERGYGGGGSGSGGVGQYGYESGVVMSRDPRPRLRWTADLHDRFVDAVTKLGGPDMQISIVRVLMSCHYQHFNNCATMIDLLNWHLNYCNQPHSAYRSIDEHRSDSQVGAETNGFKGPDALPLKEPFAGGSYTDYNAYSSGATTSSSGVNSEPGEMPIAEELRCQIEVQKRLQEQFEVQKKLQMRIEAQGKYLQAILEKAQKSLTLDMNCSGSLEVTRAQLTNFNLALSNLVENMDGESKDGNIIEKKILEDIHRNANRSLYLGEEDEKKDIKLRIGGGFINFDLNTRGSYDFIGTSGV
ncbi:myb-related protein 1 [Actinidia rufa]|uniref:Myb-related protein 1 n=1 Tax=Actinidia rufa TaxID=165716 RepID=A0A7J0GCX8_9ERIC|nr:myb-related protein 1 [Actinidia rufa]